MTEEAAAKIRSESQEDAELVLELFVQAGTAPSLEEVDASSKRAEASESIRVLSLVAREVVEVVRE